MPHRFGSIGLRSVLALILAWPIFVQANDVKSSLQKYEHTLVSVGAKRGDLLLTRLNPSGLPASFFEMPGGVKVQQVIVVDMLAYYYLGYRTSQLWVRGTEGGKEVEYQRSFGEKGRRVSDWSVPNSLVLPAAFQTLRSMKPLGINEISPRPQQGSAAVSGYQAERTYNSSEPVAESFAGYIGVVSLIENDVLVHQLPFTIGDFVLTEGFGQGREPPPGRVMMALQGANDRDIATAREAKDLDRALAAGDLTSVTKQITTPAQANQKLADGWTPLMVAIASNQLPLAQWLIERGADVNITRSDGTSALLMATQARSLEAMTLLLKHKAKPNVSGNDRGETPLSVAVWSREPKLLEALLKAGANPNALDVRGQAPLSLLVGSFRGEVETLQSMVTLMLKFGADPGYANETMSCETALKELRQKNPQAIEAVGPLVPESPTNVAVCQAKQAARQAQARDQRETNEAPSKLQAALETSKALKDNPVMAAMRQRQTVAVVSALALGTPADQHGPNIQGDTALHMALRELKAYENLVEVLVGVFVKARISLDQKDQYGVTALMLAAGDAKTQTVSALLKGGASLEIKDRDGATALFFAVLAGKTETVRLLLAQGAKTDVKQRDGNTALSLGKQQGFREIVRVLENGQ
jgi:uncharacterized protein